MKRLLLSSLMILSLTATPMHLSAANAQSEPSPSTSEPSSVQRQVTPFNLVYLARNGYFKDQGIPSHAALVSAIRNRTVTAEDLVQSAVTNNRLSAETLDDRSYLRSVNRYLREFVNETSGRS